MRPRVRPGLRTSALFGIVLLAVLALPVPPSAASPPVFTSLSPDGGEFVVGGSIFPIAWNVTHEGDLRVYATITWGTGGSASSYFITAGVFPTGGATYAWPVPTWNATDARLQVCVVTADGSQGCRASTGPFAVNATRPYVALLTPNEGANDVPLNTTMLIGFSDPADPSTILVSIAPAIPIIVTWTGGDRFLFLQYARPFDPCTSYTVALQEFGQPSHVWRFTTVCPAPPPVAPRITRVVLRGFGAKDLEITWNASPDEGLPGGTVEYKVLGPVGFTPYQQIATMPASGSPNYTFVCGGCGFYRFELPGAYFYKVRAVSAALSFADSNVAAKFKMDLPAGWNLVSVPLELANYSLSSVLQTVTWDVARTYRQEDARDSWKAAYAGRPGDLTALRFGDGLWVNITVRGQFTVAGLVAASPTFSLRPGWNLVGYASFTTKPWGESLAAVPGVLAVEAYSAAAPYHLVALDSGTLLRPGAGYWIQVAPGRGGDWVQG